MKWIVLFVTLLTLQTIVTPSSTESQSSQSSTDPSTEPSSSQSSSTETQSSTGPPASSCVTYLNGSCITQTDLDRMIATEEAVAQSKDRFFIVSNFSLKMKQ